MNPFAEFRLHGVQTTPPPPRELPIVRWDGQVPFLLKREDALKETGKATDRFGAGSLEGCSYRLREHLASPSTHLAVTHPPHVKCVLFAYFLKDEN